MKDLIAEKIKCPMCSYVEYPTPSGKCYKCGFSLDELILKKRREEARGTEKTLPGAVESVWGSLKEIREKTSKSRKRLSKAGARLPGIAVLLERSWETYKRQLITLFPLLFISMVSTAAGRTLYWVAALSFADMVVPPLVRLVAIAGIIAFYFLIFWSQAAFVFAVSNEGLRMRDAFLRGFERIGSYLWLFFLLASISVFLVMAGAMVAIVIFYPLIALALILVASVWLPLAFLVFLVFAAEGERGLGALRKGMGYVREVWPGVFIRVSLIIPSLIVMNVLSVYCLFYTAPEFFTRPELFYAVYAATVLANCLLILFFAVYLNKLYEELRALKGGKP